MLFKTEIVHFTQELNGIQQFINFSLLSVIHITTKISY